MRFMALLRSDPAGPGGPPPQALMEAMGDFVQEGFASGVLVDTGGLRAKGARVRLSGGKVRVTDGPYAEAKEIIGGFAILNAASRAEAVEIARRFLAVAGDGECELREICEPEQLAEFAAGRAVAETQPV